jgi:hypothetical protein
MKKMEVTFCENAEVKIFDSTEEPSKIGNKQLPLK